MGQTEKFACPPTHKCDGSVRKQRQMRYISLICTIAKINKCTHFAHACVLHDNKHTVGMISKNQYPYCLLNKMIGIQTKDFSDLNVDIKGIGFP